MRMCTKFKGPVDRSSRRPRKTRPRGSRVPWRRQKAKKGRKGERNVSLHALLPPAATGRTTYERVEVHDASAGRYGMAVRIGCRAGSCPCQEQITLIIFRRKVSTRVLVDLAVKSPLFLGSVLLSIQNETVSQYLCIA